MVQGFLPEPPPTQRPSKVGDASSWAITSGSSEVPTARWSATATTGRVPHEKSGGFNWNMNYEVLQAAGLKKASQV